MNYKTAPELIAFEEQVRSLFANGELPFLVHLSGGNEAQLIELFKDAQEGDWFLSTHRNHLHALLAGVPEEKLLNLIKDGRSMFVFDRARNFLSSAILAGLCGTAAGIAYELKRQRSTNRVWCFLGDGAEENGHFYEAALFVEANGLPCSFVIEDNRRQVDTSKDERRGTSHVAQEPLDHFQCVRRYYYTPTYPHGGAGLPPGSVTFKPEIVAKYSA